MKNLRIVALVLIACAVFLGGCRTARIQNVELAPIISSGQHQKTMEDVKKAIISAGYGLGWQMSDIAPGHLVATLNIRSHQAVVDITYTPETYSINYKDSTNLKYNGETIHSNYNKWIKNLTNAINRELGAVPNSGKG
ncbi:hypothetical protein [Maridesulfovibrio hydrothermalis]|uniref:Putative lipoprotein n=1 Tax=Maridesulfovibrio hydrothermalis AM13 = DSM 14728 TaxID=1121451 RepID=L0RD19_9BACT|nr:hypothetical protein [Maridesulfovibrio hydrothermalis]CCO23431.1 putative lipoprotein [Maridesulfovibrio hydrothermalis AM13 = DSM 14728]